MRCIERNERFAKGLDNLDGKLIDHTLFAAVVLNRATGASMRTFPAIVVGDRNPKSPQALKLEVQTSVTPVASNGDVINATNNGSLDMASKTTDQSGTEAMDNPFHPTDLFGKLEQKLNIAAIEGIPGRSKPNGTEILLNLLASGHSMGVKLQWKQPEFDREDGLWKYDAKGEFYCRYCPRDNTRVSS